MGRLPCTPESAVGFSRAPFAPARHRTKGASVTGCPQCGYRNPDAADFCEKRPCRTDLRAFCWPPSASSMAANTVATEGALR
jgi:hypothetical protein